MSVAQAEQVVKALLYEGYALYPYRASAVKNRLRWTFGCLLPARYCERNPSGEDFQMQTQVLVQTNEDARVEIRLRFLQIVCRQIGTPAPDARLPDFPPGFRPVESLRIDDRHYRTWQEASEREAVLDFPLDQGASRKTIQFEANRDNEFLQDQADQTAGICVRDQKSLEGVIDVSAENLRDRLSKISVRVANSTECEAGDLLSRESAIAKSFVSTHLILRATGGGFVSLLDPPEAFRAAAGDCEQHGVWPVLVGSQDSRNTMLASPIILYDDPQIAPESPGDLFDGTEIDEVLSLRIQTLTEEEKHEAAELDDKIRGLFERTHGLKDGHLKDLHGRLSRQATGGLKVRPGDRVRLRPRGRADAIDVILDGKEATVQSIEQDVEDNFYVTVTIDEDPGRDLGECGQPGHRFFFRSGEIELIRTAGDCP